MQTEQHKGKDEKTIVVQSTRATKKDKDSLEESLLIVVVVNLTWRKTVLQRMPSATVVGRLHILGQSVRPSLRLVKPKYINLQFPYTEHYYLARTTVQG